MVDGDVSIEETFAICHYLCHNFPKGSFYPSDIKEQSVIEFYISFALTDLESPIWNLLKQLVFVPEEKHVLPLVYYFKTESENVTKQFKFDENNEWVIGDNFTLADILALSKISCQVKDSLIQGAVRLTMNRIVSRQGD